MKEYLSLESTFCNHFNKFKMPPTSEDFRIHLEKKLTISKNLGHDYKIIISGELHREIGYFPGPDHRMATCCQVMRRMMIPGDEILYQPPRGNGATLKIKYILTNRI
jgi:5-methylcytosine-specific restriction protein A